MLRTPARRAFPTLAYAALALIAGSATSVAQVQTQRVPQATTLMLDTAARVPKRVIGLDDYYRLETVSSPAISPDGRWVALVRTYVIEAENRRHSEIWLAPSNGTAAPTRLTSPAFSSTAPQWSPDGTLLAFTSRRRSTGAAGSEASTWFMRMDQPGGEAFQIPGVDGSPIFSPDNRWIAFTRPTPPAPRAAAAAPAKTEAERKIDQRFTGKVVEWMGYRFDGRGYLTDPRDPAATPPRELYIVPRSGGAARQITSLGVDVAGAAWSPDSRSIAFTANTHARDEYTYERADLFIVAMDGQPRRLTDDGYDHDSPAWSPDGQSIAFRRQQGLSAVIASKQSMGAPVDVYRMPASGGAMTNLTASWDLLPGAPAWSVDGNTIYFDADIGGDAHLFRVKADGGGVEQITHGARRLGDFSTSERMDRIAYVASDPTHPAEAYAARIDGSDEARLSSFNDALVNQLLLSPAERIAFTSKDGTPVEGWVVVPPGYDPARGPYPLVLNIHGGPHGAYTTDFSFPFQLQAARGYVVLYTNPRGSTGYGERFLWATWGGGWGNKDYEDVMAGVDATVKKYAIDPKRLGVTGYSYGGFMTDWIITQTDRFAAAVAGAGISNWLSDYGTADIPRTKESEFFGTPWETRGADLLWRQSPVRYASRVKTPTLFVHGEADLRVPIEQAEQMYTALKKRRVPARFVRYPEMYHGGWTPWNTVHRYYQELAWWDQWLGAKAATPAQ